MHRIRTFIFIIEWNLKFSKHTVTEWNIITLITKYIIAAVSVCLCLETQSISIKEELNAKTNLFLFESIGIVD